MLPHVQIRTAPEATMQTPSQLCPTGDSSVFVGARRPRECHAFRSPHVNELLLRLEPVVPDTFGGLVGSRRAVRSSTTHVRGAHS
jgi:hypothetical protein